MSHSRFGLLCRKIITNHMRHCVRWDQTSTVNASKVSLNLLSDHIDNHIMIKSFSQTSFLLHNENVRIIGPCVFFPREVLHWNIQDINDINEASLSLFTILEPKVDILLIGVGSKVQQLNHEAMKYLKVNKINFEILSTEKACALFNFLNGEKRQVAAAVIPPTVLDDDMVVADESDSFPFHQEIDLADKTEHATNKFDIKDKQTYAEFMLLGPGERFKETAENVKRMMQKRKRAHDLMSHDTIGKVMERAEKEHAEEKARKALEEIEEEKTLQSYQENTMERVMEEVEKETRKEREKNVAEEEEREKNGQADEKIQGGSDQDGLTGQGNTGSKNSDAGKEDPKS